MGDWGGKRGALPAFRVVRHRDTGASTARWALGAVLWGEALVGTLDGFPSGPRPNRHAVTLINELHLGKERLSAASSAWLHLAASWQTASRSWASGGKRSLQRAGEKSRPGAPHPSRQL